MSVQFFSVRSNSRDVSADSKTVWFSERFVRLDTAPAVGYLHASCGVTHRRQQVVIDHCFLVNHRAAMIIGTLGVVVCTGVPKLSPGVTKKVPTLTCRWKHH